MLWFVERSVAGAEDKRPVYIFLLLLSVYLLFYSGQFHSADEESMLSMTESLSKVTWFDTPQRAFAMQIGLPITQEEVGADGRLYSKKGWAWPVFLAPFYAISLVSSRLGGLQTAHLPICSRMLGIWARSTPRRRKQPAPEWDCLDFCFRSEDVCY